MKHLLFLFVAMVLKLFRAVFTFVAGGYIVALFFIALALLLPLALVLIALNYTLQGEKYALQSKSTRLNVDFAPGISV